MAVNTVFVFIVGPGNLWPLAIGLGTITAAVPIMAGTLMGALGTVLSGTGQRAA